MLSVSLRTMSNWRVQRRGPAWVKVGHAVRYRKGDLRRWLHDRTING
jgi:hypothetical protein